jgi:hypothetical protein
MFRRKPPARVPDAAAARAVWAAEEIVCDAWAQELSRQQDRTDHAAQVALTRYDSACLRLTAAQLAGDPRRIAACQAVVELARETLHKRSLAAGRGHQFFLDEMELLARASTARALARESQQHGTAANAGPCETATALVDRVVVAKPSLRQRVRRWFYGLAA